MDESDSEEVEMPGISETDSMPDLIPLQEESGGTQEEMYEPLDEVDWIPLIMPATQRTPLLALFGEFFGEIYPTYYEWYAPTVDEGIWPVEVVPQPIEWLETDEPVVKQQCPICYSRRFHKMQRTDCGHLFCQPCCRTHFERGRTCPMCRAEVHRIWLCPTVLS